MEDFVKIPKLKGQNARNLMSFEVCKDLAIIQRSFSMVAFA